MFHLRALYLQVLVNSINLSLTYTSADRRWVPSGGLTGSLKFEPSGPMLGKLGEYANLFDGTSVHFENLDLARLGTDRIEVLVTPRTFDVGTIFAVTWRGFVLEKPGDLNVFLCLRLLGDISFKQQLPNLRTALTLGDLRIWQARADSVIPQIRIYSLGIEVSLNGGFSFKGYIEEFDDEHEYGFGGSVELSSEALPAAQALLKLTRLREEPGMPAIVVYVAQDRHDSLGYGFFLRRAGIGAAVNQGLRGFSDGEPANLGIGGRVERALQRPQGLPYPGKLESWVPHAAGQPRYLLAAYVLISFGLLPMEKDHPLVASAVLAIDDNLDLVMGVNGWFATAPDNAMSDAYLAHPAIKGALGLSPRQQVLYGRFMTLPNAQFGDSAKADPVMSWLKLALDAMRLSTSIYADPRGALLEVGYPRQARFELNIGPLSGLAEAGFRFGYYRGTHVIGVNLSVTAEIAGSYSGDLGFANIELSARARFQLQGSFAGALTMAGRCYVVAELMFSAYVEVSARAYKRIHISGWLFSFDLTLFDVSLSIGLTATAMLQAAVVPSGPGFDGTVDVHLNIAGFSIGARVRIGWGEDRVAEARRVIDELVPPIPELIGAGDHAIAARPGVAGAAAPPAAPALAALAEDDPPPRESGLAGVLAGDDPPPREAVLPAVLAPAPALPMDWRWYVVPAGDELRIVLFPDGEAGSGYPPQHTGSGEQLYQPREHRLVLNETHVRAYKGVVGSAQGPIPGELVLAGNRELVLTERADDTLLTLDWLRRRKQDAPREMRVGDLLADLQPHVKVEGTEVVDPRTIHPVPGDFDDPAVLADPARLSTRFRKRSGADGSLSYDDHLRNAMTAAQAASQAGAADPAAKTTSSGELLMQLLNMARDPLARPGHEIAAPGPADDYDRHLLASRIGLVLAFERSQALEEALSKDGLAAILEPGQVPRMFGTEVANWRAPLEKKVGFQIVPGYAFMGNGEVGLVWDLLRTDEHGVVRRAGPGNHAGIASFRVQRRSYQGTAVPPSAPVHTLAHWHRYEHERDGKVYFVRPQFQYLDAGLPQVGGAALEYVVEAIADDGKGDTVVASQQIRVAYRAPASLFALAHASVLLRLPAADAAPETPLLVEFVLDVEVDPILARAGWTASDAQREQLKRRIQVYRRAVHAGTVGRYGQGQEAEVTVSWSGDPGNDQLRLPNVDQARQLTVDDFGPADLVRGLVWKVQLAPPGRGGTGQRSLSCRATVEIPAANADVAWDALLGAGQPAAELHVRLDRDLHGVGGGLDLATALLRCRVAVSRAPQRPAEAAEAQAPQDVPMAEGTEVTALERVPAAAVRPREPEWLGAGLSKFQPEVAAARFDGRADEADIGIRLRGVVNRAGGAGHPHGPVVGYRVWARDMLGAGSDTAPGCIGDFLVLPEPLFRALPQSVVVRPLAGATSGTPNWESEPVPAQPAPGAGLAPATPGFARLELAGGKQALVHRSIAALDLALDRGGYRARIHADEPMWPAASQGLDRLDKVLERNPAPADLFGWRLLEAIGGCVTCWVERDDDRVDVETWAGWLPPGLQVRLVSFSRLKPGERIDGERLALYGVRVFAQPLLDELFAADGNPGKLDDLLGSPDSQLALALGIVAPAGQDGPPKIWLRYARDLLGRVHEWRTPPVQAAAYPLHLWMWEQTVTTGDDAARGPTVLPEVRGQVHYFRTLGAGYARRILLAVEVVRRYDLLPAAPAELPEHAHVVKVPRTQPLQAEHWTVAPDPATGAIRALVAVHPAQRAALYQVELAKRVQFVDQRVLLHRELVDAVGAQWKRMFAALAAGLDPSAFEASWELPAAREPRPLAEWELAEDGEVRPVANAWDEFVYPCVPPDYRYGVQVRTQAGVRHSAEVASAGPAALAEPMFTDGQGLSYRPPELAWTLDDGALLRLEFALVRGVDALPEWVREHWTRRDLGCAVALGPDAASWQVPILQLPDLRAGYRLVATAAAGIEPALRAELVQFEHADDGTGVPLVARLLVDGGTAPALKSARLVQLREGALAGRPGIAVEIDLSAPEIGWLRGGLAEEPPRWRLAIEVQRDGMRYGAKGVQT